MDLDVRTAIVHRGRARVQGRRILVQSGRAISLHATALDLSHHRVGRCCCAATVDTADAARRRVTLPQGDRDISDVGLRPTGEFRKRETGMCVTVLVEALGCQFVHPLREAWCYLISRQTFDQSFHLFHLFVHSFVRSISHSINHSI